MEDGEEEEEKEEEEKSEKVVQLWSPNKFQRDYITSDPSVTCGSAEKVAGSEGHEFNDVLQPPPPKTPPSNGAGFKSPVGVTEVRVKLEVKQAPAVGSPKCHYRPLERAREKRRLRCSVRCVLCNHEFTDLEWSQAGWAVKKMVICKTCIDLMSAGSKHRAKIPHPTD